MTKDWESVQDEIKELSFAQKKPLEEVKDLMERKYKFRASTRAYRMKLKEWGLMRHKPRGTTKQRREARRRSEGSLADHDERGNGTSATAGNDSTNSTPGEHCTQTGAWQAVAELPILVADKTGEVAEPQFMELLSQPPDLQQSTETWSADHTQASDIVLDMVGAVLDKDLKKLEKLIVNNVNHINEPIGLPFDEPHSRFVGHPALSRMVILQHPNQTLFDIACGMECGPTIWVLFAYGAKGSHHPLGTDLALHNAIKNGRPYTVQALLQPGRSDVNGIPGSSWRPLQQAVFWNVPDIVRILLNRGANVDDEGPSPVKPGVHTPLQLCLVHRENTYADQLQRARCHQIIELLLDAGANINTAPSFAAMQSNFELFVYPWQSRPYWAFEISPEELKCFELFVRKGANFQSPFHGFPCDSPYKETFQHQALWHSTPSFARLLIDNFSPTPTDNGMTLLYEVIGCCPNAKRHPSDTLRDIQVLLGKGVSPNRTEHDLTSPLRKCIADCPAVDLIDRLQVLLDGGADPEAEDPDGVQPYILAAETFDEPLLSEVMLILVAKIPGRHVRVVDGVSHRWAAAHFPIPETQTYEHVMSCGYTTSEFTRNLQYMVPDHVRSTFHKAYFTAVSNNFFDTMAQLARTKLLDAKEKDEIAWVASMRECADIATCKFDQRLVVALLDPQLTQNVISGPDATSVGDAMRSPSKGPTQNSPDSSTTMAATTPVLSSRAPFQFNPNVISTPNDPLPAHLSPQFVDDFFVEPTTQIRWSDPCAAPKPGDLVKAINAVVKYKCATCADGKLLTKKELEKHEVEHKHCAQCINVLCTRRFCVAKRRTS